MADDLEQTIRDNAAGPAGAEVDGTSVRQHDLREQIAADEYLKRKAAASNPFGSLVTTKIVPPGAS